MKNIKDIINEINESVGEGSDKLSDVIKKLQELEKEYGGDIKVIADTQDGATYNVMSDDILVKDCTVPGGKKVKYVCIQ